MKQFLKKTILILVTLVASVFLHLSIKFILFKVKALFAFLVTLIYIPNNRFFHWLVYDGYSDVKEGHQSTNLIHYLNIIFMEFYIMEIIVSEKPDFNLKTELWDFWFIIKSFHNYLSVLFIAVVSLPLLHLIRDESYFLTVSITVIVLLTNLVIYSFINAIRSRE